MKLGGERVTERIRGKGLTNLSTYYHKCYFFNRIVGVCLVKRVILLQKFNLVSFGEISSQHLRHVETQRKSSPSALG